MIYLFLIRLDSTVQCPTKLSALIGFIDEYFNTLKIFEAEDDINGKPYWGYPRVEEQAFFYGHNKYDLYGYRTVEMNDEEAEQARKTFLKKLNDKNTFSTSSHW